ncbi:uncharacterized protein LOC117215999, partial [Bombus bifarius]|uniref:Uncharacterized protein LOC117215999 n=1 Tax=Bombus bifarius TaxID=103933 RepID=A0A6P8NWI7_9HYME
MRIGAEVEKAHMIKVGGGGKNTIIVATMKSMEEKIRIMKEKSKWEKGVYMDDDLTKKERDGKQHIRRVARERMEQGTWKKIEERVDGREEEVVIIGGDWNARTGEEGGSINEDVGKEKNRRSKDKTINVEGRTLLKIINGSDKEGEERTYIGERGNSVIDYVIGNQEATEEIIYMKIGKRTESGHMPLEIE